MRKNFGSKPLCYPQPVFIIAAYGADGTPNAMNAAWGGISEAEEISICVDSGHKTVRNLIARKAFTVSMATARYAAACDYVGVVSGNQEPAKFAKAGFHATKSEFVDAPLIDELPMALECEVLSYDEETKMATIEQRNRFFRGEELEIIQPMVPGFMKFNADYMTDEKGFDINSAPHATMLVKLKTPGKVIPNSLVRRKNQD